MDFIKIGHEDLGKLLDEDPKLIQMDICRFVQSYQSIIPLQLFPVTK